MPTRQLAEELGITPYFANTLPENKADLVVQLQQEGKKGNTAKLAHKPL